MAAPPLSGRGAQGCIDGPPCMAPEPWVAQWKAMMDGDMDKARELQARAPSPAPPIEGSGRPPIEAVGSAAPRGGLTFGL